MLESSRPPIDAKPNFITVFNVMVASRLFSCNWLIFGL